MDLISWQQVSSGMIYAMKTQFNYIVPIKFILKIVLF